MKAQGVRLYRCAWLFVLLAGCGSNGGEAERGTDSGERANRSAHTEPTVERISDSVLTVTLANGRVFRFADTLRGDPRMRDWTYERTIEEIGAVLVRAAFYEGSAYLLLNGTTGDTTWLTAPPVFSPDRRRFLTASIDVEETGEPFRCASTPVQIVQSASGWRIDSAFVAPTDTLTGPCVGGP